MVECGSHDELLKQRGSIYAKLWHKQAGDGPAAEEGEVEAHHEEAHREEQLFSPRVQLSAATRLASIERRLLAPRTDESKASLRARHTELLQAEPAARSAPDASPPI